MTNLDEEKIEKINYEKIKEIAEYSKIYRENVLYECYDKDKSPKDVKESLKFLFGHTFYRGRNDTLSENYKIATFKLLDEYFAKMGGYDFIKSEEFIKNSSDRLDEIKTILNNYQENTNPKERAGNKYDRLMVISSLEFIKKIPENYDKNIVCYSIDKIKNKRTEKHFEELIGRNIQLVKKDKKRYGIYEVGPKIASFYLRDLVDLYDLIRYVNPDELKYLQPIDTYVRQVAKEVKIIDNIKEKDFVVRENIIEVCNKYEISSIEFNEGAWCFGKMKYKRKNCSEYKAL